jgi:hypothetical protein
MLRFNKEKLMVESPNDKTMLNALMHGIKPNVAELAKSLKLITLC